MHGGLNDPEAELDDRTKPISDDAAGEEKEAYESYVLSPEQREQRRLSKKPRIDHLRDGTATLADGTVIPLFDVGDRVVAERHSSFLSGGPWLDTRTYVVRSIDDDTGVVHCTDEETQHHACIGFKHPHTRIKLAPRRGDPFRVPRAEKTERAQDAAGEKKKRGRPRGSKNRPKEVIEAEKRAKKRRRGRRRAGDEAAKTE